MQTRRIKKRTIKRKSIKLPKRVRLIRSLKDYSPPVDFEELRDQKIASIIRNLKAQINELSDKTVKMAWEQAIEEIAKTGNLEKIIELTKWRRQPVDIEEFLFGRAYLDENRKDLYPGVLEALHEIDTDKYVEAVLKGAIGGGKSTIGNFGIVRQIYKISCMRNPQTTFGVRQNSSLVYTIQSVRLSTAKKAVFQELGTIFNSSPYFQEIYPYDKRILSMMIFPQNRITILPVSSSDTGAISMNVIGGVLDELNFMQKVSQSKNTAANDEGDYDQAKALYQNLTRRRRSRFTYKGKLPGVLYLISSSRYPDDFTEEKAAESTMCGGTDDQIYVWSKSLWGSKGRDKFLPDSFKVLVGDERHRSRILKEDEQIEESLEIVEVPEDFRKEFNQDINSAIRDLAGITTLASHPFIQNRESIYECMRLADRFGYQSVINHEDVNLDWSVPTAIADRIRSDVKQMRVAHADLSVTRDSAGLAIGHIAGTKTCYRHDAITNTTQTETLPIIAYDLILRIIPPRNGEIEFSKIREILYNLRFEHGLPIKIVTTDGFQSVDFRQILQSKGFAADVISVDRTTEPYKTFRDCLYDGRVLLPRHQHLIKELTELEYVRAGSKEKVDHKPRGSKDIADACAAVASVLMTRRGSWAAQPEFDGGNGMLLYGNRTSLDSKYLDTLSDEKLEQLYIKGRKTVTRKEGLPRANIRRRSFS